MGGAFLDARYQESVDGCVQVVGCSLSLRQSDHKNREPEPGARTSELGRESADL